MKSFLLSAGFALSLAVLTVAFGWLAAPSLGFAFGLALRNRHSAPWLAAAGAMAGWASLLVLAASRGPAVDLARQLGSVMQLPWLLVVLSTLIFPALLAWSAARVAQVAAARVQEPVRP